MFKKMILAVLSILLLIGGVAYSFLNADVKIDLPTDVTFDDTTHDNNATSDSVLDETTAVDVDTTNLNEITEAIDKQHPDVIKADGSTDKVIIPLKWAKYIESRTELPDENGWTLYSDSKYENVLEHDVILKAYSARGYNQSNIDGTQIMVIIDCETQIPIISAHTLNVVDIDGDGISEVFGKKFVYPDKYEYFLWVLRNGEIVCTSLDECLMLYLDSPKDELPYKFYKFTSSGYNYIEYKTPGEIESAYYITRLMVSLAEDGLIINNTNVEHYDRYISFEANDSDWWTTIEFKSAKTTEWFTLYINYHNRRFAYTEDELRYAANLPSSYKRELIIHPSLQYAVLVYPVMRETAIDMDIASLAVISLSNGQIISCGNSVYDVESPSQKQEAIDLLKELDFENCTKNRQIYNVTVTETGFKYTLSIVDAEGNAILNNFYGASIDLVDKTS